MRAQDTSVANAPTTNHTMLDHTPKSHGCSLAHDKPLHQKAVFPKTKVTPTKGTLALLKCLAAFCVLDSVSATAATGPAASAPFNSLSLTCTCSKEMIIVVLGCVLLLSATYPRSCNKQLDGYNQLPLHPVYPFSFCFASFTACFWLVVYTNLPGWFQPLVGLTVMSLAVLFAYFLFVLTLEWRGDMRQRVVRGHVKPKELHRGASSRLLHKQRPRLIQRPSTKAFDRLDARGVPREETLNLGNHTHNLQITEAEGLTMSKLRVPLLDFLWVWCAYRHLLHTSGFTSGCSYQTSRLVRLFIAPNAVLLWVTGVANLLLRQWLVRKGWIRRVDFSASQVRLTFQSLAHVSCTNACSRPHRRWQRSSSSSRWSSSTMCEPNAAAFHGKRTTRRLASLSGQTSPRWTSTVSSRFTRRCASSWTWMGAVSTRVGSRISPVRSGRSLLSRHRACTHDMLIS